MQENKRFIGMGLMKGKKAGYKRCDRQNKNKIIGNSSNGSDPCNQYSPEKKKQGAANNHVGHDIRESLRQAEKAYSP